MAAATDIRASANKKAFFRKLQQKARFKQLPGEVDGGFYAFDSGTITVNATNVDDANDELFVLKFPEGAKIINLRVDFSDMDSGANLLIDVNVETDGGSETTLINAVNAQSAVVDELDAGLMFTDVGGQYLGHKVQVGAAGGALAGTARYRGVIFMGDLLTGF